MLSSELSSAPSQRWFPPDHPSVRTHTRGSALEAYRQLAVGARGTLRLLEYELLASWGAKLPGALGFGFRRLAWPMLLGRTGRGVVWGSDVTLRHPGRMWIGDGVLVDDHCFFDARGAAPGRFRLGTQTLVSRGCVLSGKDGDLVVGARATLGPGCVLVSCGGLAIGADCVLAGECFIGGGVYDADEPIDRPMRDYKLVTPALSIGDDCWIGAHVVVAPGVRIGRGCVIGAGAVVMHDLPPYSIAEGAPARVVRRRRGAPAEPTGAVPVAPPAVSPAIAEAHPPDRQPARAKA